MGAVIRKWPREMAKTTCSYIRFNEERNVWKIKLCEIAKGLRKVRIIWARSICTEFSCLWHQSHVFLRKKNKTCFFFFFSWYRKSILPMGVFVSCFQEEKWRLECPSYIFQLPAFWTHEINQFSSRNKVKEGRHKDENVQSFLAASIQ